MTSRQKRWYAERGIDWREVEAAVEAAKQKPVEVVRSRKQELAAAMESRGYIPVIVPPSDSAGGGAVDGAGEPLVIKAGEDTPPDASVRRRSRARVGCMFGMMALALSAGVPDMPRESPKPWRRR